jgi:muramoyltetrapeptide carboxypeptidase
VSTSPAHPRIIRAVAPSGPVPRERVEASLGLLERHGFEVRCDERVFTRTGYLAGDDEARLTELHAALAEPGVEIVWAARGGYGAMRLLPHLDLSSLRHAFRLLVGFSDITALHAAAARIGVPTLHACVLAGVAELEDEDRSALLSLLAGGDAPLLPLEGPVLAEGEARGPVVGGNLSVLTRLIGTPYAPPFDGAILLLEDVAERPYRVDRMLTHLELAGIPERLAGVVIGELRGCEDDTGPTALEVVGERVGRWGLPAMAGAPVGHGHRNQPVPLGVPATLDTRRATLSFEPTPFPHLNRS